MTTVLLATSFDKFVEVIVQLITYFHAPPLGLIILQFSIRSVSVTNCESPLGIIEFYYL